LGREIATTGRARGTNGLPRNIAKLCFIAVGMLLLAETASGHGNGANERLTAQVAGAAQPRRAPHYDRSAPGLGVARLNADTRACVIAIAKAEARYGIPPGLLQAIAKVESGRSSPATGELEPWPWSINVSSQGLYFSDLQQAVQFVRRDQAQGRTSIDTGCLQINLQQHPTAFATLTDAFDPSRNADYAARFLLRLRMETDDWTQAVGFYHSRTPALAASYRSRVARLWTGSGRRAQAGLKGQLQAAWASTLHDGASEAR
jgi:transglycosylase-like protein with SLT domain